MGTKVKFKGKNPINCAVQAFHLRKNWQGEIKMFGNRLNWKGNLTPTPLSVTYLVSVDYSMKKRPDVRVLEPKLEKYNGQKIPHLFHDGTLCLFRFKYKEWDYSYLISDTIIPWTLTWLYFYEVWLISGVWHGKGEHPKSKSG